MSQLPGQLPDSGYILIGCICVALIGLVGLYIIVRAAAKMRATVLEEISKGLGIATPPLVVKQHEPFVSLSQHEDLANRFVELTEQRRKDVGGLHVKIEQGIQNLRTDITTEFKEMREEQAEAREAIAVLKSENVNQTVKLSTMDVKMDQVLMRLPRK